MSIKDLTPIEESRLTRYALVGKYGEQVEELKQEAKEKGKEEVEEEKKAEKILKEESIFPILREESVLATIFTNIRKRINEFFKTEEKGEITAREAKLSEVRDGGI